MSNDLAGWSEAAERQPLARAQGTRQAAAGDSLGPLSKPTVSNGKRLGKDTVKLTVHWQSPGCEEILGISETFLGEPIKGRCSSKDVCRPIGGTHERSFN